MHAWLNTMRDATKSPTEFASPANPTSCKHTYSHARCRSRRSNIATRPLKDGLWTLHDHTESEWRGGTHRHGAPGQRMCASPDSVWVGDK